MKKGLSYSPRNQVCHYLLRDYPIASDSPFSFFCGRRLRQKACLATDTRSLREIAPLLENYFGITLGYFTNEIESSTGISAAKAIQEEHEIRLPTNRFDYDAYMEQFGETPLLTDRLREALLFMAYIITDRKFNEQE